MSQLPPHKVRHVRLPHIHFPHIRFNLRELRDRPLSGAPTKRWHWRLYVCEALATTVMMVLGLSACILLTASSSPIAHMLRAHPILQTALCGLCFGLAGTAAALSRFGKVSGAHLSPSVSLAFSISGRLQWPDMLGYFGAQTVGAFLGTGLVWAAGKLLPDWGHLATQAHYAGTFPTPMLSPIWVMGAEVLATAGLILVICWFVSHPRFNRLAPWWGALYFCLMNPLVAWMSGDSTNFPRSLAPALVADHLGGIWVYLVGPFLGSGAAALLVQSGWLGKIRLREARIVNFGHYGRVPRVSEPEAVGPSPDWVARNRPDATRTATAPSSDAPLPPKPESAVSETDTASAERKPS